MRYTEVRAIVRRRGLHLRRVRDAQFTYEVVDNGEVWITLTIQSYKDAQELNTYLDEQLARRKEIAMRRWQ